MFETLKSTARHLGFALRALAFRRVAIERQRATGLEPGVLIALLIVLDITRGLVDADQIRLSAWGVTALLGAVALMTGGLLLAGARRRGVDVASLVATLLAMAVWGLAGWGGCEAAVALVARVRPGANDMQSVILSSVGIAGLAWFAAAAWIYGARATAVQPRRFGLGVAMAALAALFVLPSLPVLERADDDDGERSGLLQTAFDAVRVAPKAEAKQPKVKPIDVEAAFARQPALIDRALEAIAPARPGNGTLYFVGLATYAAQDVFLREISAAREIADERLGTRGRSVVMVNHRDTVETLPLATATNLERVLWRLAQVMDADRDVLLLFITTHGSEGILSVSFPGFRLNDLTPERLAGILQRTGIKNRVVVLSACHAGSFLPALAGPDTMVMAAARADRASFGCSNERDWTYFGDALFNHALRETRDLEAAFARAATLVGNWERAQKLTPASEPQIAVGARIQAALGAITKRLDVAGP